VRKILISFAVAIVAVLAGAGTAAASGTPQSPQSQTVLVSCPNMEPFTVISPTPPSRVGLGLEVTVIPEGHLPWADASGSLPELHGDL
jgi:hypothetical protein